MKILKYASLSVLLVALTLSSLLAHAKVTLRVQTAGTEKSFNYVYIRDVWAPKLTEMTNGEVAIEVLPSKAMMPTSETPDGVAKGLLSGDLTAIAYFSDRNPGFDIMGDLIAGYDKPIQMQSFCREGGGEQMLQKLWDTALPDKIHVVGCGAYTREAFVSTIPIRTVADLQGVKVRSPEGMAANVFKAAGASPFVIAFSDVYVSLENGIVDAADASAYSNNDGNGLHNIAKYPIYPGIHSMATEQFTVSKNIWNSLSSNAQEKLREWFYAAYADMAQKIEEQDQQLVARDQQGGNITVIDWAQEERDKFRKVAEKVWKETASKSPEAKEALDMNIAYMKKIGLL